MLDRNLEPTEDAFQCECDSCGSCCKDSDWMHQGFTLEEGVRIAEFNYECKIYGEIERQKAWSG